VFTYSSGSIKLKLRSNEGASVCGWTEEDYCELETKACVIGSKKGIANLA